MRILIALASAIGGLLADSRASTPLSSGRCYPIAPGRKQSGVRAAKRAALKRRNRHRSR